MAQTVPTPLRRARSRGVRPPKGDQADADAAVPFQLLEEQARGVFRPDASDIESRDHFPPVDLGIVPMRRVAQPLELRGEPQPGRVTERRLVGIARAGVALGGVAVILSRRTARL